MSNMSVNVSHVNSPRPFLTFLACSIFFYTIFLKKSVSRTDYTLEELVILVLLPGIIVDLKLIVFTYENILYFIVKMQ